MSPCLQHDSQVTWKRWSSRDSDERLQRPQMRSKHLSHCCASSHLSQKNFGQEGRRISALDWCYSSARTDTAASHWSTFTVHAPTNAEEEGLHGGCGGEGGGGGRGRRYEE